MNLSGDLQKKDFFHLVSTNVLFVIISLFFVPFLPATASFEWFNQVIVFSPLVATVSVPIFVSIGSIGIWWLIKSDTHPYVRNRRVYRNLTMLMIVAFNLIGFYTALQFLGINLPLEQTILITVALSIMFVGNVFPKLKPNYVIGIRNPFTLADDVVWIKTHQFTGYLYLVIGTVLLITVLLTTILQIIISLLSALCLIFVPFIYSLGRYRQREKTREADQHVEN